MKDFTDHSDQYNYSLPDERIAQFPLEQRDASRLLVYKKDFSITDSRFNSIAGFLPDDALLMFNETRVIRARMNFEKDTGAKIEVFCLEPLLPSLDFASVLSAKRHCRWLCMVGNAKKWKSGTLKKQLLLNGKQLCLELEKVEMRSDGFVVDFRWDDDALCFGEIIEAAGNTPLPPYIKRSADAVDNMRYQTIYASKDGSVAAPTAGLHFTDAVFEQLKNKRIQIGKVVLHVGAGTFKPISDTPVKEHVMHSEAVEVSKEELERLLVFAEKNIINVGTTTVRTLESLYWHGVKLMTAPTGLPSQIDIKQWDPYQKEYQQDVSRKEVLTFLLKHMEEHKMETIGGYTQLMIVPGYRFRMTDILITNFHQPQSTLLLLVSAFTQRNWKKIYEHALENEYRFLSYGDSCLLLNNKKE